MFPLYGKFLFCMQVICEGSLHKQGGGMRVFIGRKSWKARYIVLRKNGKMGIFNKPGDFKAGKPPLKRRWVDLTHYRLESTNKNQFGIRLIPTGKDSCCVWLL